jgi:hypothetical protein
MRTDVSHGIFDCTLHTCILNVYSYHPIPWLYSISRPIAPVSSVAGVGDTTRPGHISEMFKIPILGFIKSPLISG